MTDRYGYRWDDTRYALLDRATPTVVRVVVNGGTLDAEAFYLAQALGVAPASRPVEVTPVAPGALSASLPSAGEAGDVIVVIGTDGLSRSARARIAAFVENGGGLLLVVGPGIDPRLVRDLLGESVELGVEMPVAAVPDGAGRRLAVMDPRHPVFRPFGDLVATLGRVRFTRMARILLSGPPDVPAGADRSPRVLARFDQGDPALIEYARGDGRALVLASDLGMEWNDFPPPSGLRALRAGDRPLPGRSARHRRASCFRVKSPAGSRACRAWRRILPPGAASPSTWIPASPSPGL